MNVTKTITIDLLSGSRSDSVCAVQGDAYTRAVALDLRQGRAPWAIPEGVSVMVEYQKSDGTAGLYDTLPDGTQAWSAVGNVLTIQLAPQMLTAEGSVVAQVRLMLGQAQLSVFKFWVYVNQKLHGTRSENYINWRSVFLPQTEGAAVGQYLQITQVDDDGRVTGIRAVEAPQGSAGGITTETDPTVPEWAKQPTPPNVDIPANLPNPYALTFTGAVNATYDGSEAVEVEIPAAVTDDHIKDLINTALGVIEDGTY